MTESEYMHADRASAISGFFEFGHGYEIFHDTTVRGSAVQDRSSGSVVALVPELPDTEFITRTGRWHIAVERRGRARGWAIVARTPSRPDPVAAAYPRSLPGAYKLWLASDDTFRMNQNIITGTWTLRQGRARLARAKWGRDAMLDTFEGRLPYDQLALLLCLAIETMRCEAQMPHIGGGGGG
jgi:hypothetical protein